MTDASPTDLAALRERVLAADNRCCFIERETLLAEFDGMADQFPPERRYAHCLEFLLARVSTPIDEHEAILGRAVEGVPLSAGVPDEIRWKEFTNWNILGSPGHMTLDYETLLAKGLHGIAADAQATAGRLGTPRAWLFAENAAHCAGALEAYARRYAAAARAAANAVGGDADPPGVAKRAALLRAAAALDCVPHGPARDFCSALQSVWLVHMLMSCYIGGRDYGFGRMDQYLWPFYLRDVEAGRLDDATAVWLLAQFMARANIIAGTACAHYRTKPVPCQSSKQYIILGGATPGGRDQSNRLSLLFLEAARLVQLPEPILNVRWHPGIDAPLKSAAAAASIALQGQVQFMNDRLIPASLVRKGIAPDDAYGYTANGCSRIDAGPTHSCNEHYLCPVHWLHDALRAAAHCASFEDLFTAFEHACRTQLGRIVATCVREAEIEPVYERSFTNDAGEHFHLESLLVRDCVARGLNTCQGGPRYLFHTFWFAGIATITNSLMAVKHLVFDQGRFSLADLLAIVAANFEGHEPLRQEIIGAIPKYGNDLDQPDALAARVAAMLMDALEQTPAPPRHILYGSFYSLMNHQHIGRDFPATLDGRRAGEPLSENQSPTYGTDVRGITATLKSVARLPFDRACSGCLNLRLHRNLAPAKLVALIDAFFSMGGAILGVTFVDRATLEAALERPEEYRSLYVRMYGFSEYFTCLPRNEQLEIINRTEH